MSNIVVQRKWFYKIIDVKTGKAKVSLKNPTFLNKDKKGVFIQDKNGTNLLFRQENRTLTLFLTSKCNHRCIMCPQRLDIDMAENDLVLSRVIDTFDYSTIDEIYITGGEPFIKENIIKMVLQKAPQRIMFYILTNGSLLPPKEVLADVRCKLCVPLYASYDELHNHLTGSNSFYRVVRNVMQCSAYSIPIELRFVIMKQNYKNMLEFARFVTMNLPFVQNVAFMGVELQEFALKNKSDVWINPREYITDLLRVVQFLREFGIKTWIYNLQKCLFPINYRKFVVSSISDWKRSYLPCCKECAERKECGGIFCSDMEEYKSIIKEPLV